MTEISQIYDALESLGVTRNYKGCRQAGRAIQLALEDEEREQALRRSEEFYQPVFEKRAAAGIRPVLMGGG